MGREQPVGCCVGRGNGYSTKDEAVERALQECGGRDAVKKWCKNAWIALALSDESPGGYGWAGATTASAARTKALRECRARNPDAHIVACVSSNR